MTFILISGEMNVGKTYLCNKLHQIIDKDKTFTVCNRQGSNCADNYDFLARYEKDGKHIVLNSPSDNDVSMSEFGKYLDSLAADGVRPDIIIATIRQNNNGGFPMSRMLALLDALSNGMPNLENYHKQNIEGVTSFAPTSLCHNAFVLHLERQDVDGVSNKNKALGQYADGKAETAKQMLDLAIERL